MIDGVIGDLSGFRPFQALLLRVRSFTGNWLPRQVLPSITNTRVIPEIFGNQIEGVRVKTGSVKPSQRVEGY